MKLNLSIRASILVTTLFPLLLILLGGIGIVSESVQTSTLAQNMSRNVICFQAASDLITELQRERGRTSMLLTGALTRTELDGQRRKTDARLEPFRTALNASNLGVGKQRQYAPEMFGIDTLRSEIGATVTEPTVAISRYSEKIDRLLQLMNAIANTPTSKGVGKTLTSLLVLESAKENAGILRATVSGILGVNQPLSEEQVMTVLRLKGGIDANLSSKALTLLPESVNRIKGFADQPDWRQMNRTIRIVLDHSHSGDFGIKPAEFWQVATSVVDDLEALVRIEISSILAKTAQLEHEAILNSWGIVAGLLGVLCMALVFALVMATSIIRPIHHLVAMFKDIAEGDGDLTQRLAVSGVHEISDLARHFNRFVEKLQGIIGQMVGYTGTVASAVTGLSAISVQTTQSVQTLSSRTATVASAAE